MKEGLADEGAKRAIGPRTIDCLRALGRYGAIGGELDRRTNRLARLLRRRMAATAGVDPVVALLLERSAETARAVASARDPSPSITASDPMSM